MTNNSKTLQAEIQKLAQTHGIDLNKVELTNTDLELVRGGLNGTGLFGVGPNGALGGFNFNK